MLNLFRISYVKTEQTSCFYWSLIKASDEPLVMDPRQIDERIGERINGELLYLNGELLVSATTLNKSVYTS